MNARTVIIVLSATVCAASLWAVAAQRQQLVSLRAQRQANVVPSTPEGQEALASTNETAAQPTDSSGGALTEELLKLRSEVTRLSARKRALTGVAEENARLQAELASNRTNAPEAQLPAGFMRKAQAQFVGYGTPENTFQSFLFAMRNHDLKAVLQSLTPAAADKLQARIQDPDQMRGFFRDMDALPGLALQNRSEQPDGSVQFETELLPGIPKETMTLRLINGEWKLDLPF